MEDQSTRGKPGRKSRAERAAEMTGSPEFQSAVAAAVQSVVAPLMAQLEAARLSAGSRPQDGDAGMMSRLAMSIAELTNQGTGKSKVAPEVMQKRAEARERMVNLIIEARAEGKVPSYQLRNKVHFDDRIIEPLHVGGDHVARPTEIDYLGVPNEAMVPLNEAAKGIFQAFKESIGTVHGVAGVANQLPPEDRLGVTPKGTVVRNSAVTRAIDRATPALPSWPEGKMPAYEGEAAQTGADQMAAPTVTVKHESGRGQFKDVNVLGTIMRPAQQTV